MSNPTPHDTADEGVRVPAPGSRERVEELLRLLGKAARAHQLYLPNNPVYKSAHDAVRAAFLPIWDIGEELVLAFTESEVKYEGAAVLTEASKGGDSLPWLFFKDGVREIRLARGFETEEIDKLLGILQRLRKATPDEDDLLTMLWEGDFVYMRYRYMDLSMEQTSPLEDGGEVVTTSHAEAQESTEEESQPSRSGVVNMSDFDGTLYFLDEKEIEYIQREIQREYQIDLRQNVVAIILDIFEQQTEPSIRAEVCEVLENLMLHMLSAGQFQNVALLLRESTIAAQRATDLLPEHRTRLELLSTRLSAPEALAQLLQSLDDAHDLPSISDVLELFDQLQGTALGTVLDWLGKTQNTTLRPMLEKAAHRLAAQNTAELVKLVLSPTSHVSLEAIRRAGSLQTPAAVAPLARVLAEGATDLRLASVQALSEIASPGALQALERAIEDTVRDVRVAAVRVLQARVYRPALPRLEAMIKGKAVREADLTEKMAMFEAYGTLCGEAGVASLDATLNGRSMFGRREDAELRACAAVALGRIKTGSAEAALRKATGEKDVVVRNAVSRALRGTA